MKLRLFFATFILASCSSSSNNKLLKDSIYIYESTNNIYESLSDKTYSLNFDAKFDNDLSGNIQLDSFKPKKKLKIKIHKQAMFRSNIVASGNYVYFFDSKNTLYKKAINNSRESVSLTIPTTDNSFSSLNKHLTLNKNHLSVVIGNNTIYHIDTQSLTLLWQKELASIARSAVINDGRNIFVTTIDNVIYALDINNGNIKWKRELDSKQTSIYGSGNLTNYNQHLIFSSSLGETVALNKKNGKIIWNDKINLTNIHNSEYDMFDTEAEPIIKNNKYYNWNYSGLIISYNLASGIRNWSLDLRPITNLWLIDDIIYTVAIDKNIVAIDQKQW